MHKNVLREKGISDDDEAYKRFILKHPPVPVFFYFQQISALRYQCSVLRYAEKKKEALFFPFDEILNGQLTQHKAELIDVWMLGQSFRRMF